MQVEKVEKTYGRSASAHIDLRDPCFATILDTSQKREIERFLSQPEAMSQPISTANNQSKLDTQEQKTKSWSTSSKQLDLENPSTCTILHSHYVGYHMQGKGISIQANPSEFEWLCWRPKLSDSPSIDYFVFGKEVNGSMRYMTYQRNNSKDIYFRSCSQIDFESTDQDPRLFYWKGNSLVSAASKTTRLHVCLNDNTFNVEVSDLFEDDWIFQDAREFLNAWQ